MTPVFTLYRREGCHLCEDMLQALQALSSATRFVVEQVDIDLDPQLQARFNADVPVLALGDDILCKHFLDEACVREALKYV